jgi:hypothetical protein
MAELPVNTKAMNLVKAIRKLPAKAANMTFFEEADAILEDSKFDRFYSFPMEEFDVRYKTKALWSTKIVASAGFMDTEQELIWGMICRNSGPRPLKSQSSIPDFRACRPMILFY